MQIEYKFCHISVGGKGSFWETYQSINLENFISFTICYNLIILSDEIVHVNPSWYYLPKLLTFSPMRSPRF